jgi:hypothetical protein
VPHKTQVMNLLFIEEAVAARAAAVVLQEPKLLVKTDRVYAEATQACRLANVNGFRHLF